MTIPSVSASVQSRDDLILEDFIQNWEELLRLGADLRDKERKTIRKVLHEMKLKGIATLIQRESDNHGYCGFVLLRSPVKNLIYIVFFFSTGTAVVYEVNIKKIEVKSWGHKILSASRDEEVLEQSSLPSGSNWIEYRYMFPLQCIKCSIKKTDR